MMDMVSHLVNTRKLQNTQEIAAINQMIAVKVVGPEYEVSNAFNTSSAKITTNEVRLPNIPSINDNQRN